MIQRRTLVKAVIAALAPLSMTSAFAAGGPSGAHIGYQHQGQLGAVVATGTPISNSMVELYTIQRYLQMSALEEQGLQHFDAWAANYGETVTAIELSPEGTGYRAKINTPNFPARAEA